MHIATVACDCILNAEKGGKRTQKNAIAVVDKLRFFSDGEGEIRTLAPVIPTYTLSRGASSANLSTSPYMSSVAVSVRSTP